MRPINILLYEDKPDYRDSFKLKAQQKRIIVDAVDNVDELLELLEENRRKHKFVVLDARAYLHEGQTSGSESEANLHKIFRDIEIISKKQDRVIPYCVNTGFADIKLQYQEVLPCSIFEKGEEDDLFQFIWDSYENTDGALLRKEYGDVFDFADGYFDDAGIELLSNLLLKEKFKSNRIVDRVNNLSCLRRLVEHSMDILFINYLHSQHGIIKNRASRSSDVINYLNSLRVVPTHIFGNVINVLKTASNYGSHTPEDATEINNYPSNYTIESLTSGFMDTILWARKLLL